MVKKETIKETVLDLQTQLDTFLQETQKFSAGYSEFDTIATGIGPLDTILGGGIGLGSITMLVGRPGCGKSSLAANIMGSFQKASKGKSLCIYVDTEQAMTSFRLAQLGVISPKIKPYQNLTVEDVFKVIDSVIAFKKENSCEDLPCVIVWDSLANTLTQKETQTHDPKEVIGYKARVLSLQIPNYTRKLQEFKISLIIVNQLRDNVSISMFGPPQQIRGMKQSENIPGGRAILYNTNQLIYLSDAATLKEETYGFGGKEIECYCIKNKLFPPMVKTRLTFSFMGGYSDLWSKVALLKNEKLIAAKGSWLSMEGREKNFQTKSIYRLYKEDPTFKIELNNAYNLYTEDLKNKYKDELAKSSSIESNEKKVKPKPAKKIKTKEKTKVEVTTDTNEKKEKISEKMVNPPPVVEEEPVINI